MITSKINIASIPDAQNMDFIILWAFFGEIILFKVITSAISFRGSGLQISSSNSNFLFVVQVIGYYQ